MKPERPPCLKEPKAFLVVVRSTKDNSILFTDVWQECPSGVTERTKDRVPYLLHGMAGSDFYDALDKMILMMKDKASAHHWALAHLCDSTKLYLKNKGLLDG